MVEANCPDNEPSGLVTGEYTFNDLISSIFEGVGSLKDFLENLYFNGPPEAGAGYYKRSDEHGSVDKLRLKFPFLKYIFNKVSWNDSVYQLNWYLSNLITRIEIHFQTFLHFLVLHHFMLLGDMTKLFSFQFERSIFCSLNKAQHEKNGFSLTIREHHTFRSLINCIWMHFNPQQLTDLRIMLYPIKDQVHSK